MNESSAPVKLVIGLCLAIYAPVWFAAAAMGAASGMIYFQVPAAMLTYGYLSLWQGASHLLYGRQVSAFWRFGWLMGCVAAISTGPFALFAIPLIFIAVYFWRLSTRIKPV